MKDLNPYPLLIEIPANDDLHPDSSESLGVVLAFRWRCRGKSSAEISFAPRPAISRPNLLFDDDEPPVAGQLAFCSESRTERRIRR